MEKITLPHNLLQANFVKRINRFAAAVEIDKRVYRAYVPSSGRMKELLLPGAVVLVSPSPPGGRTDYKLLLVKHRDTWVSVDSLLPNRLVSKALRSGCLPEFAGYSTVYPEKTFGRSRFDFLLLADNKHDAGCYIEVKSVTLVEDRVAKFPDAPSKRGTKHIYELVEAVNSGWRAAVMFVVQRDDAESFAPNGRRDREFAAALNHAARNGVEVYARKCVIDPPEITLHKNIPVKLEDTFMKCRI
ncbi:sugar fermentation stimulation protein A [Desulfohalotomaculum tongense]|uniref:DNA/RNA nuclease SfsA n=1 Tax=Desulforadius tongensis TaxID=1216062 RepID=UPI0019594AD6|nr:DNA/RNA nuclease SfsA [Desulforadius tongensis]MBM7855685.1 sugar fermentation stimulation protein A [Desulforadius tongensis]